MLVTYSVVVEWEIISGVSHCYCQKLHSQGLLWIWVLFRSTPLCTQDKKKRTIMIIRMRMIRRRMMRLVMWSSKNIRLRSNLKENGGNEWGGVKERKEECEKNVT